VQQPAQKFWKKLSLKFFWVVPLSLSVVLVALSFIPSPHEMMEFKYVTPDEVYRDEAGETLDIRLTFVGEDLGSDNVINPSLLVVGNDLVVTARRHRISSNQFNGNTAYGDGTIIENVWHSDVVVGRLSLPNSPWWDEGFGDLSVKTWELEDLSGGDWSELCTIETWIPENSTLMRKVVTGPEDPKPIQIDGDIAVVFNSLPPLGYYGCEPGGAVSQMYLAGSVDPLQPDDALGRRLTCGFTRRPEKNWVPFTRRGNLHFAYSIVPHKIVAARTNGDCETVYSTTYAPLSNFLQANTAVRARGSGQALLIDGEALDQTSMSIPHFLGLMHLSDIKTGAYAHFAYRFSAEPPYEILQVSQQLPLQPATSRQSRKTFAFASGLSMHVDTDAASTHRIVVSYGAGDQESRALIMPLSRFDEYFKSCGL